MVTLLEPVDGYTKAQFAADLGAQDSQAARDAASARLKTSARWLGGAVSFADTPGAFGQELEAGTYWVVDLQGDPLEANVLTLEVAGTPETTQWPALTAQATSDDDHPWVLPATLPTEGVLQVSNSSSETRRLVFVQKPSDLTLQQWLDELAAGTGFGGHALPGTSFTSDNVEVYWMYELPPGQYAVLVQPLQAPWDGAGAIGVTVE